MDDQNIPEVAAPLTLHPPTDPHPVLISQDALIGHLKKIWEAINHSRSQSGEAPIEHGL